VIKTVCAYCGKELEIYFPLAIVEIKGVVYSLNIRALRAYHKECWEKFVKECEEKQMKESKKGESKEKGRVIVARIFDFDTPEDFQRRFKEFLKEDWEEITKIAKEMQEAKASKKTK
jgi:hypothetical protein